MIRSQRRHTFPQQQEQPHSDHHYPSDDRRLLTMETLQLCPVVSEPPPPLAFPTGPPVYEGPFQIIEPGSEFYVQTDPNFCLEPLDTVAPQNLFLSENGIPPEVLADVFGLEDELEATYGMRLPSQQRPVPENVTLEQYETQLVAEMERLFPDVASSLPAPVAAMASPVAVPENIRTDLSEKPRYMNVQLADDVVPPPAKGGTRNVPVKHESLSPRDTELGFRCVNVTDDNGTTYKAKFYDHVTIQRRHSAPNKISYPTPLPKTYQAPSTTAKTPTLKRNVSLQTPLRAGIGATIPPPRLTASSSSVSTIVIKAPKRTIAAGIGEESLIMSPFFPMPIIKQEPRDDDYLPESFVVMESPPSGGGVEPPPVMVTVPIVTATTSIIKQPRKQKLLNLSQESEMVFKESSNVRVPGAPSGPAGRAVVAAQPPKDYVTVTIPDTTDVKPQPLQHHLHYTPKPVPNPFSKELRSPAKTPGAPPKPRGILGTIERTHYRVLTTHSSKQEFGQPVESIEILDSSDEEKQPPPPPPPPKQQPQREKLMTRKSKPLPVSKPKLQGNTESIQCPYCCKIFLSPKVLISHVQNCADAHLFRESSRHRSVARANSSSSSVSLIRPNCGAQAAKSSDVNNNNEKSAKPNPTTEKPTKLATSSRSSKKKRLCLTMGPTSKRQPSPAAVAPPGGGSGSGHHPHHKRSERLSIEILPSAFCIDNLLLCVVCQKSFRSAEQMEVHQKIHRAPVACEYCGKKFYESPPTKHVCQEMKRSI